MTKTQPRNKSAVPLPAFHQVSVSVSPPRTELWPVSLQKAQSYWDAQKFLVSLIPQLTLVVPVFPSPYTYPGAGLQSKGRVCSGPTSNSQALIRS